MQNVTIALLIIFIAVAGVIWLQVFFSKKENKWFGLILPLLCFGYSLLMIVSVAVYEGMSHWDIFGLMASILLISNIPTFILLVIYFACREKFKRKRELGKMNIQDLE